MINLNELMEIADSRAVCVRVPVTRRLYGEMAVYSFKPNELTGALDIDLAMPDAADRGSGA